MFVYDVYNIVEDIFLVNVSVNCLFAVYKLSVWILANCWDVLQRIIIADDVNKLLRLFAMWFINYKRVVEMIVNNDMNLLRIWLALLNGGQQVVWMW